MTHPTHQQWMAYLYGELDRQSQGACAEHLGSCGDCREQVAAWRGAMTELSAWQLPAASPGRRGLMPLVKWGVAAMLLVGAGYAAGRLSRPGPAGREPLPARREASLASPEASIAAELRQELNGTLAEELSTLRADLGEQIVELLEAQTGRLLAATVLASREESGRLLAVLAESHEAARIRDRQMIAAALAELELRRRKDHAALRRDLQVLALLTGEEFLRTEQGIVQLLAQAAPVRPVSDVQPSSNDPNKRSPK